jgi:hypothetical protein
LCLQPGVSDRNGKVISDPCKEDKTWLSRANA